MKQIVAAFATCLACLLGVATPADAATAPSAYQAKAAKVTILSTMLSEYDGIGEWGFAALVEVDGHKVLFDTGARPDTVLQNAAALKIDLSQVTDVVLSHFHDDHTGGLMTLRNALRAKNPAALSRLHVAQGIFDELHAAGKTANVNHMAMRRDEFVAGGGTVIVHDKADEIAPGIWLTGPVPRRFPERNWSGSLKRVTAAGEIDDAVQDDMSMVIRSDDGLIVLTGCGHAGIGNILVHSRAMLDNQPVKTVIGGLHLYAADEAKLRWTANEMHKAGVTTLLAAHCTGLEATYRLRALLHLKRKDAVVAAVGSSYSTATGIDPLDLAR
jgi:7,8-dihydropterin-6-yl-methyl-4-(beta-D-ribofuranosyl)aminobenzene 5'-phosphate synthase